MVNKFLLVIESFLVFTSCNSLENNDDINPLSVSVNKVYGDGSTYCAFTSLEKKDNTYYIAFREGETHAGDGDYGRIKIMRSVNGITWEQLQVLSLEGVDLRDPNLSVMPDGRLLLLCGARYLSDVGVCITRTYKSLEKEDGSFEAPEQINLPQELNWETCSWVWRLTWQNGIGYGVCYGVEDPVLLKTKDGINYEIVSTITIPGSPSECRVRFKEDGTAIMIVRRDADHTSIKGYWGEARPPYTDWEWKELSVSIAGEDFIIEGDKVLLATRMTQNIGSWTAVWFGDINGNFNWCYTFPYGCTSFRGDTGYTGILNEPDEYWVSYFAIGQGEKPSIFLVRIPKNILVF